MENALGSRALRRSRVLLVTLVVGWGVGGCVSVPDFATTPPEQRRLAEGYRALMSPAEERTYLSEPTYRGRLAYAESLGLRQRFEQLPPEHRAAVLEQEIREGMSAEAVLLSWGEPYRRSRLTDGHQEWFYTFAQSPHLPAGVQYWLFIDRNGVLDGYHWDMLDAPSADDDRR